ncbi:MAG: mannose-1-phosphate guanylyltransferase [Thermodesulfobacteriota bacterium]
MEMYALIMAGGEGKRFWPLSSRNKPKQFLSLTGEKSMIRQTVDRILPLIPIENIFVVTVERYRKETLKHIPELPGNNLILEPEGKNTAPCIAYGTLRIKLRAPEAVTVVLPADHAVGDDSAFREVLRFAADTAGIRLGRGGYPLITLGVTPTTPETGYGYIKAGDDVIVSTDCFRALKVSRFAEKPDLKTALAFLRKGGYYWNSGVFVWKTSSIISEFSKILPGWHEYFGNMSDNMGKASEKAAVSLFYKGIEPGSIDKLILERSQNTAVIPVTYPWSDVGSWKNLDEYLRKDGDDNIFQGRGVSVDSSGCLVFGGDKVIALVGVKDIVVVDSKDGVLILNKEKSQEVKRVVEELSKRDKD